MSKATDMICEGCMHRWKGSIYQSCPSCGEEDFVTTYKDHLIGKASYDPDSLTEEENEYLDRG